MGNKSYSITAAKIIAIESWMAYSDRSLNTPQTPGVNTFTNQLEPLPNLLTENERLPVLKSMHRLLGKPGELNLFLLHLFQDMNDRRGGNLIGNCYRADRRRNNKAHLACLNFLIGLQAINQQV